jgi:accessory colonization factor AcfC
MLVKTLKLAVVFAVTSATVARAETLKVYGPGGPLPAMQERDPRSSA